MLRQLKTLFLNASAQVTHCHKLRAELKNGETKMCINLFGKMNSGQNHDCMFVWKAPVLHSSYHDSNVTKKCGMQKDSTKGNVSGICVAF